MRYDSFLPFAHLPSCTFIGTSKAVIPKEMKNNSYATFWGQARCIWETCKWRIGKFSTKDTYLGQEFVTHPHVNLVNDRHETHSALNLL